VSAAVCGRTDQVLHFHLIVHSELLRYLVRVDPSVDRFLPWEDVTAVVVTDEARCRHSVRDVSAVAAYAALDCLASCEVKTVRAFHL